MASSRREEAKEERRTRILASAERLIRRRGNAEFSMRELADDAGVAFATPFNLFESKEGLLASLLARRIWPRQESLAAKPVDADPIAHVIDFTSAAFETYTDDEELLRPLVHVVISPSGPADGRPLEEAADLWTRCLEPARVAGLLRDECDTGRLGRALHLTFRGALLEWVRGEASAEAALADARFAVRAMLAGVVVDSARDRTLALGKR